MSFPDSPYLDAKNSIITRNHSLVMCFGTFDIFHPGHSYYLSEASKLAEYMVVVIARDHRVISGKGKAPLHSEYERQIRVQSEFPEAHVILGDEEDIFAPLRTYQPDILAFGYDQKVPEDRIHEQFPNMKIIRIDGFETHIHKSSIIRNTL